MANYLKRAETDIVLSVLDVRAYSVSFSASLDMNQLPEKLYLGQNLKWWKKLLYIKSLGTDKTDVTPMRSDGQITADTKQKSNIPNSVSPYSP
jgi:hypothetical protein